MAMGWGHIFQEVRIIPKMILLTLRRTPLVNSIWTKPSSQAGLSVPEVNRNSCTDWHAQVHVRKDNTKRGAWRYVTCSMSYILARAVSIARARSIYLGRIGRCLSYTVHTHLSLDNLSRSVEYTNRQKTMLSSKTVGIQSGRPLSLGTYGRSLWCAVATRIVAQPLERRTLELRAAVDLVETTTW